MGKHERFNAHPMAKRTLNREYPTAGEVNRDTYQPGTVVDAMGSSAWDPGCIEDRLRANPPRVREIFMSGRQCPILHQALRGQHIGCLCSALDEPIMGANSLELGQGWIKAAPGCRSSAELTRLWNAACEWFTIVNNGQSDFLVLVKNG